MEDRGVSTVARSNRGFLRAYEDADGDPRALTNAWVRERDGFVARHRAQVQQRGEPLWEDGQPTRRHLALIAWAWTPDRTALGRWVDANT
jgi:hypothetical protein